MAYVNMTVDGQTRKTTQLNFVDGNGNQKIATLEAELEASDTQGGGTVSENTTSFYHTQVEGGQGRFAINHNLGTTKVMGYIIAPKGVSVPNNTLVAYATLSIPMIVGNNYTWTYNGEQKTINYTGASNYEAIHSNIKDALNGGYGAIYDNVEKASKNAISAVDENNCIIRSPYPIGTASQTLDVYVVALP